MCSLAHRKEAVAAAQQKQHPNFNPETQTVAKAMAKPQVTLAQQLGVEGAGVPVQVGGTPDLGITAATAT